MFPRGKAIRWSSSLLFLALVIWSAGPAKAQQSARVMQRNLAEMVDEAATIVRGRVLSARVELHPQLHGLQTLVLTLRVAEVLKGEASREFTFRQWLPGLRDQSGRLQYKTGQEVLLLLIRPSEYGLSSPAGLEQGRFFVTRDDSGELRVMNTARNFGLFRNILKSAPGLPQRLSPAAQQLLTGHRGGPIPYEQFRELVRGIQAERAQTGAGR